MTARRTYEEVVGALVTCLSESEIVALAERLHARDRLLERSLPHLERLLAAQGETPDRDLLALQHEIATHLAPPPVPF